MLCELRPLSAALRPLAFRAAARSCRVMAKPMLQPVSSSDRGPGTPADLFHPAVAAWFARSFPAPTAAQAQAWPAIQAGRHVLIAAPTGSGKTLAAFLAAIDSLVRQGLEAPLEDATQVVYVSPLKALSNDIQRNLEAPLAGIREALRAQGLPDVDIRTWVRTGDTPQGERDRARKRPPHIVVTTPESLYILLGSESGRKMLATTRTVIVDEIHALAPNKRGSHLALSLERLASLCGDRLLRIGLSATQKPIDTVARFLVGTGPAGAQPPECTIVDIGHRRARDLALEVPSSPLEAVMSAEVWEQVYERLAGLIEEHRTTLIFVNTRRMAERVASQLHDAARREADRRAPRQHVEGAPARRRAAAAARRAEGAGGDGLAGARHRYRRGRTWCASWARRAPSRASCSASAAPAIRSEARRRAGCSRSRATISSSARRFVDSANRGELDRLVIPEQPLDVLAQQIVAEVGARECSEHELLALLRRAWPYRALQREAVHHRGRHAGRGLHQPARAARRAHPPRCGERPAARTARRPPHRPHLRRHHPRQRRLPGAAGAREPDHRLGQRGLGRREHGRRRVPARQRHLPHPARGARRRARRGRPRRDTEHPVLAGRGARPQRRVVGGSLALPRRHGQATAGGPERSSGRCAG